MESEQSEWKPKWTRLLTLGGCPFEINCGSLYMNCGI